MRVKDLRKQYTLNLKRPAWWEPSKVGVRGDRAREAVGFQTMEVLESTLRTAALLSMKIEITMVHRAGLTYPGCLQDSQLRLDHRESEIEAGDLAQTTAIILKGDYT